MINAIALDDEPPALRVIENFCGQTDFISLQKVFTGPAEALKYLRRFPVDLLFLDIQMPSLSGVDFCKIVPQQTMVIFVTAHSQYAVEGFNLNAVDYLLKPYTLERFLQAANKARDFFNYLHQNINVYQEYIFVRADYQLIKITIADIIYIEGLDDYIKIFLTDQKTIVARMTMKNILEKLPVKDFIRVHRSFIIPFSKIECVRNKVISIAGKEIPLGSSYEDNLNKRMAS
jgi:DNA-binding LytR/AlgR family response regulator